MEEFSMYEDYENDFDSSEIVGAEYTEEVSQMRAGMTMTQMHNECVEPTWFSASDQLSLLFVGCLLFKIVTQKVANVRELCHLASIVFGLLGMYSVVGVKATYTAILGSSTYFCVLFCAKRPLGVYSYRVVVGVLLIYLVSREYVDMLSETWEQVRGIQMLMVLKTISVCFELATKVREEAPPVLDYLGYMFCPATVVFGPWIPFRQYDQLYDRRVWSFGWVVRVFAASTFGFLCLSVSSCWVYWLFLGMTSSWILAIRDALSVRFSHYFISTVSEITTLLSGFYSADGFMNIEVCKPWKIEFPRSLVEVVVYWNMPMHMWLKFHIFRPLSYLNAFWPLIITFLVSSLLHGLNFGLTMVLLSLGLYTYVEYTLREKLASIFSACIKSKACLANCEHSFKSDHWGVYLVNAMFRCLAYFHLSYLGIMMDKSNRKSESVGLADHFTNELKRWQDLSYASHWVVLAAYLASVVI